MNILFESHKNKTVHYFLNESTEEFYNLSLSFCEENQKERRKAVNSNLMQLLEKFLELVSEASGNFIFIFSPSTKQAKSFKTIGACTPRSDLISQTFKKYSSGGDPIPLM
jgi:hypothetical protein